MNAPIDNPPAVVAQADSTEPDPSLNYHFYPDAEATALRPPLFSMAMALHLACLAAAVPDFIRRGKYLEHFRAIREFGKNRIALAHHWLVGMRGGERVLEQLCLLFPKAPIHTLVSNRDNLSDVILGHSIQESWLQRMPQAPRRYKSLLPLFPLAVGTLRVDRKNNFVFSTDASVIKGLGMGKKVPHVCYCHSPPRYLWEMQNTYLKQTGGLGIVGRIIFRTVAPYVRWFDRLAARRVTHFIANSRFVQRRIASAYGRESEVIYPPVAVDKFRADQPAEDYYLIVTELVAYKRVDLAIDAFNQLGKRLVVLGDGPESETLRSLAGPTIEFLGRQPFGVLRDKIERCRAFIYPQIEDFGITAVEAQAAGRPVIAFRSGGAMETVIEGRTGLFFDEQTAECLVDAVKRFEAGSFSAEHCRANAERFRPEVFRESIRNYLTAHFPDRFPAWETAAS